MRKLEIIFIILLLAICFRVMVSTAFAQNPLRVTKGADTILICEGERVLASYRYIDVPFKPCVQQLFSPQGVNELDGGEAVDRLL